nr:cyclic nucleotide-binding domain-containing protein [Nitrospinaceae bacterium]NIR56478.1 cyclic nucleotide-binding domain-containing protein [Nitrospinaceae bacterium]NIS86939.1 cyclic nucleotide-binding domain-containing protein [Nitrospinaceae bacterium]NIT83777.1 cyclic nucleotide-binding domain-containing protein [Nitrospinaceae bacterium]NIU45980.1 cyclic nucleotide-binding domain-containing protein [Nitrospinaceae bacterium]
MTFKQTPNIQRYSNGDVIVSEGIVSNNAYIIMEGKVNVTKKVDKKSILINSLGKGEVFGEMGLISKSVRSATVVAVGNVTIGVIEKEQFESIVKQLPEDIRAIVNALVERLRY